MYCLSGTLQLEPYRSARYDSASTGMKIELLPNFFLQVVRIGLHPSLTTFIYSEGESFFGEEYIK